MKNYTRCHLVYFSGGNRALLYTNESHILQLIIDNQGVEFHKQETETLSAFFKAVLITVLHS